MISSFVIMDLMSVELPHNSHNSAVLFRELGLKDYESRYRPFLKKNILALFETGEEEQNEGQGGAFVGLVIIESWYDMTECFAKYWRIMSFAQG